MRAAQSLARQSLAPVIVLAVLMAVVIYISNVLVAKPINDWLTYATFTFPLAFLVTDITNRLFGVRAAHKVVLAGFAMGVVMSILGGDPRIGIASGIAFLSGQFLDILIFSRLRQAAVWVAPAVSSFIASAVDTVLFYTLAFAAIPLLGLEQVFPGWQQVALGDFGVKIAMAIILVPIYVAIVKAFSQTGSKTPVPAE